MATIYKFKAYFTENGIGTAPSCAPVATVVDTDTDSKLVTEQVTRALTGLAGYYGYEYSGADGLDLVCLFHTDDIITDQQDLVSYIVSILYQIDTKLDSVKTWTATNIGASVRSGTIIDIRGNDWLIDIVDLTLDADKQQFAIKYSYSDMDAGSILLVDSVAGLIYLNGEAVDVSDQSKAALSYVGTTLTLTVKAEITAQLPPGTWLYGIQFVSATGVVAENYGGKFTITADTIRATI